MSEISRSRISFKTSAGLIRSHLSDVVQSEVKHDHAFHSDSATSVRGAAKSEGLNVSGDLGDV